MALDNPNGGGPAFPYCVWVGDHHQGHMEGMLLRDYFAAQWLAGLAAATDTIGNVNGIAKACYAVADAMLEARKK